MTTHLRGRALQAGAFLAMVGGTIAVAASPALAVPPGVTIDNVSSTSIASGERTTIRFTITNPGDKTGLASANVEGLACSGDCSPRATLREGESVSYTATLTGGQVDAGQTEEVRVQVTARLNNETASATETITVRGPDKPRQVRQVSGRVRDADGKAVSGAQVLMRDSQGHQYSTTSDGDGGYQFTSSDNRPITPGTISVGAAKDGYDPVAVNVKGVAGKTVNVPLTLALKAAASPSATPSATETPSTAPVDEVTDAATEAAEAAPTTDPAAGDADSSSGLLFFILGGLLVAAGVGAIVLVLMRRKDDDEDADDPDAAMPAGGAAPFADATRVAAPVGGRAPDATMITPMSGAPMSDAPTMLQRPVDDEFADPYGAVLPTYGAASGRQYGPPTQYGAAYHHDAPAPTQGGGYHDGYDQPGPQQPSQYGRPVTPAGGAGYGGGEQSRYDEPTGMYQPGPDPMGGSHSLEQGYEQGGYGQEAVYPPAGRDRPEPTGYQAGGGYSSWGAPAGGIGDGNAYEPAGDDDYGRDYGGHQSSAYEAPAGAGGYGAHGGGYGAAPVGDDYGAPAGGGYGDVGGYDPRSAYGQPERYEGHGQQPYGGYGDQDYPEQDGYYGGDQGGRHGGGPPHQQPPPGRPGQRRSADWLDD